MSQIRKRLTYANVMSSIAVFFVLGGATAFAAGQLAKNSVGTKQLKNNAVTTKKIKKNAVTGAKVKNNSLTGGDIDANTLGTVPKAAKSEQLVNIFYAVKQPSAKQTILSLGGLTVTAECPGSNESVQLEATTSVSHSLIDFYTPQDGDYEVDEDFNVGDVFDADDGHDEGTTTDIYTLRYSRPDGVNVWVELRDVDPEEGPVFTGTPQEAECLVTGYGLSA